MIRCCASDTVVTPDGVSAADIHIRGETILGIGPVPDGARLIDMTGSIVMPGGIDPHVHCAWLMLPPPDGGLPEMTKLASVVSRAAIHGGTTLLDFVRRIDGTTIEDAIARRTAGWAGACHTDIAFHLMVEGDIAPDHLTQFAAARLSFTYEGRHRTHVFIKGRQRDTDCFSIIEAAWPSRCDALLAWLAPANFAPDGTARAGLAELWKQ